MERTINQDLISKALHEPAFGLFRHEGLWCLIIRGRVSMNWLGYVGVPEGHPYYGRPYDGWVGADNAVDDASDIECHYGLTYSGEGFKCTEDLEDVLGKLWWFGFDTDHYMDLPLIGMPFEREGEYRDYEFMVENVKSIAEQLKKKS